MSCHRTRRFHSDRAVRRKAAAQRATEPANENSLLRAVGTKERFFQAFPQPTGGREYSEILAPARLHSTLVGLALHSATLVIAQTKLHLVLLPEGDSHDTRKHLHSFLRKRLRVSNPIPALAQAVSSSWLQPDHGCTNRSNCE
ncbi:jg15595 [Pararge aegeria aegeria]|uniref:Jg15595 protein n=1 Tax=Pararge aegeria aegeria TaxID=348720 RepID=A0A8S4RVE4_9NEOP|nr:jg15595 [Pararge aegeria aegeria]